MHLQEAQALWTLGLLPREAMPSVAVDTLERGFDHPALRALAGLTKAEFDEAAALFEKSLVGLGMQPIPKMEALRVYTRWMSRRILAQEITPYDGASLIASAALQVDEGRTHEVDPFIYAADEYEDRPEDRDFFAKAILEEAGRWVTE